MPEQTGRATGAMPAPAPMAPDPRCPSPRGAHCLCCGPHVPLAPSSASLLAQARASGLRGSDTASLLSTPQVSGALFEPPPFQPQKLKVQYLAGARASGSFPPPSRRYTLTHNDITGALQLSIGSDYNQQQVQGFYTRILRDEITAEWYFAAGAAAPAELHIYCHVSGEERWLAPPQLRNFIFRREMTLVRGLHAYSSCGAAAAGTVLGCAAKAPWAAGSLLVLIWPRTAQPGAC